MDFYTHLYAKPAQTAVAQDEQPKEDEKKSEEQENSPTAKDGFFGLFNRSEAAKKGWDTRKQNGGVTSSKQWTPGVWPKKSTSTSTSTTSSGTSHVTSSGTSHSTTGSSVLSNLPKHLTRPKSCKSEIDANRSMYAASNDELPKDENEKEPSKVGPGHLFNAKELRERARKAKEMEESKSVKKLSAAQLVAMRKKAGLQLSKTIEKKEKKE